MAGEQARKYMLTIQDPQSKGFTHEMIRDILASMNVSYYCLCDEIATTGRLHTHVFFYRSGAIRESTVRKRFPGVHFDVCRGTCAENRDYILKTGKWAETDKAETSVPGTFEEWGELPEERAGKSSHGLNLIAEIDAGKSTADIVRDNPGFALRCNSLDVLRQTLLTDRFKTEMRDVTTTYLYGPTGTGKTRSIFEAHPIADICRVTNYGSAVTGVRFDAYTAQKVLVFEEFHSQIPLPEMLNYLDRYPLFLPARYADRVACYTQVYITSNLSPMEQYLRERKRSPETWRAFMRRILTVIEFRRDGSRVMHEPDEFLGVENEEKRL